MIKPKATQYDDNPTAIQCYAKNKQEDAVYIPLGMWNIFCNDFPNGTDDDYPKLSSRIFNRALLTRETDPKVLSGERQKKYGKDQDVVAAQAIKELRTKHTTFIACYTGFGKTTIGTYLSCYFGLKTIIVTHISVVKDQWPDSIRKFTKLKVQLINKENVLDPEADVYVMGVMKANNFPRSAFTNIGMVIVDETHKATVTTFSKLLLKFRPRYLIGLSATPDRLSDGLHVLLEPYFGEFNNYIIRKEKKDFTVIKYKTKYKPDIEYNMFKGKARMNWSHAMASIAENEERQNEIVELVLSYVKEHKIFIGSDRQTECIAMYQKLSEKTNGNAALLIDKTKVWDKTKKILVAGIKKAGAGFDDPELSMLVILTSFKDVRQLEGRIRMDNNIVIDVVDNLPIYENHWKIREKWYLEKGAKIVHAGYKPPDNKTTKRYLPPRKD